MTDDIRKGTLEGLGFTQKENGEWFDGVKSSKNPDVNQAVEKDKKF